MIGKSTFHGTFVYYENINGKEKKVAKEFTDPKKFNEFTKKHPMPTLGNMLGIVSSSKKALPMQGKVISSKECCGSCGTKAKLPVKKKK